MARAPGRLGPPALQLPQLPPTPLCAPASTGPHSQIFIQVVVEDGPQLKLLKAADGEGQTEVQVEFMEHSDPGRRGHTQAWWMRGGVAEGAETRGLGVSWPQGPRREGRR